MEHKVCTQCGINQPLTNYYKNGNRLGSCCKDCHKKNIKQVYDDKVNKVNQYKADHGCKRCGETRYWVLDFHHPDPNEKEFNISDGIRNKFETILPEIQKCDVLCSNCHRDWHYRSITEGLDYNAWLGELA